MKFLPDDTLCGEFFRLTARIECRRGLRETVACCITKRYPGYAEFENSWSETDVPALNLT